jgi:hypothetical protein
MDGEMVAYFAGKDAGYGGYPRSLQPLVRQMSLRDFRTRETRTNGLSQRERCFRRTAEHFSLGAEPRPVTWAVPRGFRLVPAHQATHVRANG